MRPRVIHATVLLRGRATNQVDPNNISPTACSRTIGQVVCVLILLVPIRLKSWGYALSYTTLGFALRHYLRLANFRVLTNASLISNRI